MCVSWFYLSCLLYIVLFLFFFFFFFIFIFVFLFFFFFQAEDGIRDWSVTGVQTCALPISGGGGGFRLFARGGRAGTAAVHRCGSIIAARRPQRDCGGGRRRALRCALTARDRKSVV